MATNIKVYFVDGSYKSLLIDQNATTVEELWNVCCDKLELGPSACECFYLWGYGAELELLLSNDETIDRVMHEWPALEQRYSHSSKGPLAGLLPARLHSKEPPRLVFRTTAVLTRGALEKGMSDLHGSRLLYLQAVYDVVHSNYPIDELAALELAGLQLQVGVGNMQPSVHTPGYLSGGREPALALYLPAWMLRKRNKKWYAATEEAVFLEWARHKDQPAHAMMAQYLSVIKVFPSFGSTFFKVHHDAPESQVLKQKFEGEISFGISQSGVHMLDTSSILGTPRTQHFPHNDIGAWGSDKKFFWFQLRDAEEGKGQVVLTTPVADVLRDLMTQWSEENKRA